MLFTGWRREASFPSSAGRLRAFSIRIRRARTRNIPFIVVSRLIEGTKNAW